MHINQLDNLPFKRYIFFNMELYWLSQSIPRRRFAIILYADATFFDCIATHKSILIIAFVYHHTFSFLELKTKCSIILYDSSHRKRASGTSFLEIDSEMFVKDF